MSYNTALLIKHKIQRVMKMLVDSKPTSPNLIQLDDAYWGGKNRDGCCGREATGKMPFDAAVSTKQKCHPIHMRFSHIKSFSQEAILDWAFCHLNNGSQIVAGGLLGFETLGKAAFSHQVIITGEGPKSVTIADFKWVNTIIGSVKRPFYATFHAFCKNPLTGISLSFVIASTVDLIFEYHQYPDLLMLL